MNTPLATALARPTLRSRAPGLLLAIAIALLAWWLGRRYPLIGGPVFGILLGIAVRNLFSPDARFTPGIAFGGKQVLQWSIIALGFGLSLTQVAKTGLESLSVTLVTLTVAFLSAWALGRWLGVHDKLKILIGVGTAICGGSAIAAVTPIIKPDEHDTAFAISTIFLFNVVAVLLFPLLGQHFRLVGGPVIGIVLGIVVANVISLPTRVRPGILFASKQVLQWSIIALGFGLSLDQVAKTGLQSLSVTLVTMSVAFVAAWALGRWLRVHDDLKIL
ncbi:MAG TPA: putative sulfate exporter family transporter, partial [Rhodanobacter sp.]